MKKYLWIKKVNFHQNYFRKNLITLVGIVIGILFLYYTTPTVVRSVVAVFWTPYDVVRVWLLQSNQNWPVYWRDRHDLVQTINQLKKELALNQKDEQTVVRLENENQTLRSQLDLLPPDRIVARVLARPERLPYDVIMLDRGANDGVLENTPVFFGQDKVVGIVTKILPNISYATLVTTPGFLTTAYVYGANIYTNTEGMGSGVLRVRVPQGLNLTAGDMVVLPALDSGLFGVVARVETSPTKPEKYGYIVSEQSLQSWQYVSIGQLPIITNDFVEAKAVVANIAIDLLKVDVPIDSLVTPETFLPATTSSSEVFDLLPAVTTANASTTL